MPKLNPNQFYYKDLIKLGFKRQQLPDPQYFDLYGVPWVLVSKQLMPLVSLEWDQQTLRVVIIRIDSEENQNIMSESPIRDMEHLKEVIAIFRILTEDFGTIRQQEENANPIIIAA